jgi:hypothetical protein
MNQAAARILTAELDPGERLLWSGQPHQGVTLRGQGFRRPLLGLLTGSFCACWGYSAFTAAMTQRNSQALIALLLGTPIVAGGIWVMFGRYFTDARARARTYYGITNLRIILVWWSFGSRRMATWPLRALVPPILNQRRDGSGTITFDVEPKRYLAWSPVGKTTRNFSGDKQYEGPWLDMIDQAKDVFDIINRARGAGP